MLNAKGSPRGGVGERTGAQPRGQPGDKDQDIAIARQLPARGVSGSILNPAAAVKKKPRGRTKKGGGAALGNTAEFAADREGRFRWQSYLAEVLGQGRMSFCLRRAGFGVPKVRIVMREGRAAYRGVFRCENNWLCPWCSQASVRRRAAQLRQAQASWEASGGVVMMVTFTLAHKSNERLGPVYGRLAQAFRHMLGVSAFRAWRKSIGWETHAKALEVTYGRNGWHPHLHLAVFGSKPWDGDAVRALRVLWRRALQRVGGECVEIFGCHVQRVHDTGNYMTKWDFAAEMAAGLAKGGHQRVFGVPSRVQEFAHWQRGKAPFRWARGAQSLLGFDDDPVEAVDVEDVEVVAFDAGVWERAVRAQPWRALFLLTLAEAGWTAQQLMRHVQEWARAEYVRSLPPSRAGPDLKADL